MNELDARGTIAVQAFPYHIATIPSPLVELQAEGAVGFCHGALNVWCLSPHADRVVLETPQLVSNFFNLLSPVSLVLSIAPHVASWAGPEERPRVVVAPGAT